MKTFDLNIQCDFDKLFNFCQDGSTDHKMPASENMEVLDWENKSHTLLNAIFIQRRFDSENRAGYIVVEKNDRYVAGSGFYPLEEDNNICVCASRTYTVVNERMNMYHGEKILPMQFMLASQYNYKSIILTFNEYNLWLKEGIERLSSGKGLLSKRIPASYTGWQTLKHPINIKNTKQWCLYKHLDNSYDSRFNQVMADLRAD